MASKRNIRRRACDGKVRFTELQTAWHMVKLRGQLGQVSVYRCQFCKGYHKDIKRPKQSRPKGAEMVESVDNQGNKEKHVFGNIRFLKESISAHFTTQWVTEGQEFVTLDDKGKILASYYVVD